MGDSGIGQEASYTGVDPGSKEPYFEQRQLMRDHTLVKIVLPLFGVVFPAWAIYTFVSPEWPALFGVLILIGIGHLFGSFMLMGVTTTVRSDGVFQQVSPRYLRWIPLFGYGNTELAPSEIHGYHVITESGIESALDPSALPGRTRRAIESGNVTGVYLETTGDQPGFSAIVTASGLLGMHIGLYGNLPGLVVTDRPEELAEAIERVRSSR